MCSRCRHRERHVEVGAGTGTVTYDLQIASTEESLTLDVTTSADSLPLASIGPAADIVS